MSDLVGNPEDMFSHFVNNQSGVSDQLRYRLVGTITEGKMLEISDLRRREIVRSASSFLRMQKSIFLITLLIWYRPGA